MRHLNLLTIGITASALLLSPTAMRAGILNSPHDFHTESWNNDPGDPNTVCSPCHQAHNADSKLIPLWGHQTSQGPWTMYSTLNSPSFKGAATETPINDPGTSPRTSQACLSCHDGTVAVNSYGGVQHSPAYFLTNSARIAPGGDLTHSHPISFLYNPALIGLDKWLVNPDTPIADTIPDTGTFIPGNAPMTIKSFMLGNNYRMECSSCHDVHNQEGTPFDITTNPKLIRINGTKGGVGSLLCRTCHIK